MHFAHTNQVQRPGRDGWTWERTMSFEQSLAVFLKRQEEFASSHYGKYVVIHGDRVVGFFDDQFEAYNTAKAEFPEGSFLLRQCLRQDEERTVVMRSRVA